MTTVTPNVPRHAFTLIELMVVLSIVGVLIGILLPAMGQARQKAQAVVCLGNLRQIGVGTNSYLNDNHFYFPMIQTSTIGYTQMAWLGKAGTGSYANWNTAQRYLNAYLGGPYAAAAQMPIARCPTDTSYWNPYPFYDGYGASYTANAGWAPGFPTVAHSLALTTTQSVKLSDVLDPRRMVAFAEFGAFDPVWSNVDDGPNLRWHDINSLTFNVSFVDGRAGAIKVVKGVQYNNDYSFYRDF